jgi:DNA-binding MarR family transcriptional regulator
MSSEESEAAEGSPRIADRASLLAALHRSARQLANQNGLYTDAAAARLGLNRTDLDCLSIVHLAGPVTAGDLAETTGLTTGAITGVIDRLEKGGFVVREADPNDRRRVIVTGVPDGGRDVGALFGPMHHAIEQLYERYTDDELAVLLDLNDRLLPIMQEETARLRETPTSSDKDGGTVEQSSPLGNLAGARLEFVRGAANIVVRAGAPGSDLYRARGERHGPAIAALDGTVTVNYKRSSFRWSRGGGSELELNPTVPWTISVRGGASRLRFDLNQITVRQIDVVGGVSNAEIHLPEPRGTITVHVTGGAHNLTIHRPTGVPLALRVRGGVSNLRVDDQRFGSVGGTMTWQSPDYAEATDRVEVTLTGGASTLTLGRV